MAVQIQIRNDLANSWASANPVLAIGEFGYETDTGNIKVGDGATSWNSLSYNGVSQSYVDNSIVSLIDSAPGALDTLAELANALNNDGNFAATVTNSIASKAPLAQPFSSKTNSYILTSSDSGGVVAADGTLTITIPSGTFTTGERVDVINKGTGTVTFAGNGVTINSKDGALTLDSQYAAATIVFESSSVAYLIGDIA